MNAGYLTCAVCGGPRKVETFPLPRSVDSTHAHFKVTVAVCADCGYDGRPGSEDKGA